MRIRAVWPRGWWEWVLYFMGAANVATGIWNITLHHIGETTGCFAVAGLMGLAIRIHRLECHTTELRADVNVLERQVFNLTIDTHINRKLP